MLQPDIDCARLLLRPFTVADATTVHQLVNSPQISGVTANIPYPYTHELALEWIARHPEWWRLNKIAAWAIIQKENQRLTGAISLIGVGSNKPSIGYWVGVEYWGRGFCSEAANAVCRLAFERLAIRQIGACHLARNPASGRVLTKTGFLFAKQQMELIKNSNRREAVRYYTLLPQNLPGYAE
ncbi:GNAT family N-acetyltransferase [Affinibrenneria salicis]|uniref:GNAT family N-acetyltransferase n=1 Tax=Affinibrenneria salicis TaxID=2590031 RepID=A0A5J5FSN2_9GAMM|nr:GNAT family N-acetyltransferase [Affinibrenneria salicis]KAA8996154.1 GNAT family N-acetyltransferase [Affinibrenneria salicis]